MNSKEDRIELARRFVENFDGDVVRAGKALHEFAVYRNRQPAHPKRELSDEIVISVENLKKSYKVGRTRIAALNDVSLEVHKGEFLVLTGASGSGKSTLLQLMGGLDKPSEAASRSRARGSRNCVTPNFRDFATKRSGLCFNYSTCSRFCASTKTSKSRACHCEPNAPSAAPASKNSRSLSASAIG